MTRTFSLRRIHLWLFVAAVLAGILTALPPAPIAAVVAVLTAVVFGVGDLWFHDSTLRTATLTISYWSFALAVATAVAFGGSLIDPAPPPGAEPEGFIEALAQAITFVMGYIAVFGLLSLLSFSTATPNWRSSQLAKWLVVANIPGVLLAGHLAVVIVIEVLQDACSH